MVATTCRRRCYEPGYSIDISIGRVHGFDQTVLPQPTSHPFGATNLPRTTLAISSLDMRRPRCTNSKRRVQHVGLVRIQTPSPTAAAGDMGVMGRERDAEAELNLPPGFRFHPTDEELVVHYLCRRAAGQCLPVPIIREVDLYKYDPWDLPEMALFGQREWYFFTPRDRKYPNGSRPNRTAGRGYWKATGADKPVSPPGSSRPLGIKKALVFYQGKAPKGVKTDWIMHEYRLADTDRSANKKGSRRLDDWVLCRLYNKKNNWEKMQQKKAVAASFGRTMDSFVATDDTRSDSLWTTESDIEHDASLEFGDPCQPGSNPSQASVGLHHGRAATVSSNFQIVEGMKEETDDWFTDLNLDEFQGALAAIGPTTSVADISDQDYYSSILGSPYLNQSQVNMPPFWS
ncbi:unnamed protein product [Musa acuminata subsp. burmannicoides]